MVSLKQFTYNILLLPETLLFPEMWDMRKCSVCLIVVGSLQRVAAARVNYVLVSPGHLARGSSCRHGSLVGHENFVRKLVTGAVQKWLNLPKRFRLILNYWNVFSIFSLYYTYIFYVCGWNFSWTILQFPVKLMKVNRLTCPQVFIKDHSHQSWWLTLMHSIISQADDTILFLYSEDFFDQLITWWWMIEMYPCSGLARVSC